MSKLIAFRLPDDLVGPFEARCRREGLSATGALVLLVRMWLGESEEGLPVRRQTRVVSEPERVIPPRGIGAAAMEAAGTHFGPVKPPYGSRLKKR